MSMIDAEQSHAFGNAADLPAAMAAFARDIKVSHSVFAMPWALLATVMAGHGQPAAVLGGKIGLIAVCMVTARTTAMAANRILDADVDAENPRTARRAIPGGTLSRSFVTTLLALSAIAFIAATSLFYFFFSNPWPVILSLPVLAFVTAYPLLKRFTRLCHYYLGVALGLAPVCAWVATAGRIDWPPVLMGGAVVLWTAGFDIIYACQDYRFDVDHGLFSIPAKLGTAKALWVSRLTHAGCVALLIAAGLSSPLLGAGYFTGVAAATGLLIVEHNLVSPTDFSKANLAFFTMNGIISLLVGTLGMIDVLRH
jgi:4-hydroxybenzoate polyprenyltransferase